MRLANGDDDRTFQAISAERWLPPSSSNTVPRSWRGRTHSRRPSSSGTGNRRLEGRLITIKSRDELASMGKAGLLVAEALQELQEAIRPGISTAGLDQMFYEYITKNGGVPSFKGYHGFPASICTSLNDEVVHGVPSKRRILEDGDILSIDCGITLDGWHADAAVTVPVGNAPAEILRLLKVTKEALCVGIEQTAPGKRVGDVSAAIQRHAESNGYSVVREYVGYGIGRQAHEEPQVPNWGTPGRGVLLKEGMALAVNPIVNVGAPGVRVLKDAWTVVTADGKFSANFKHTVAITREGPRILTELAHSRVLTAVGPVATPIQPTTARPITTAKEVREATRASQPKGYAANAFRALRLPVTATDQEVRSTLQELRLRAELSGEGPDRLQFIQSIEELLADAPSRLRQELYWIHLCPDPVPPDLDLTDAKRTSAAMEGLQNRVAQESDIALHDLAVLQHAASLETGSPCLEQALLHWRSVWEKDEFWFRLVMRAEEMHDPRATPATVDMLRSELPRTVLQLTAQSARAKLARFEDRSATQFIREIVTSGFPADAVEAASEEATADLRAQLRGLQHELQETASRWTEGTSLDVIEEDSATVLIEKIKDCSSRLHDADQTGAATQTACDPMASTLRQAAIGAWNADAPGLSVLTLQVALRLVFSAGVRQQLEDDWRTIDGYISQPFGNAAAAVNQLILAGNRAAAISAARELSNKAVTTAERTLAEQLIEKSQSTSSVAVPAQRKARWPWGLLVFGLIAGGRALASQSSPGTTTNSPRVPTAAVTVARGGFPLSSPAIVTSSGPPRTQGGTAANPAVVFSTPTTTALSLSSLRSQIESERPQLQAEEDTLRNLDQQLTSLEQQLRALEAQYPNGAPSYVVSQYDSLRSQYNAILADYKARQAAHNQHIDSFNAEVDQYNAGRGS